LRKLFGYDANKDGKDDVEVHTKGEQLFIVIKDMRVVAAAIAVAITMLTLKYFGVM